VETGCIRETWDVAIKTAERVCFCMPCLCCFVLIIIIMSVNKLKIMSNFNNSLRITFSVQNYILLDSRFYWRALSCVWAGADYSCEAAEGSRMRSL